MRRKINNNFDNNLTDYNKFLEFTKSKNTYEEFMIRLKIEKDALKIGRTFKSIANVARRWCISLKDALELCKNFEERQSR